MKIYFYKVIKTLSSSIYRKFYNRNINYSLHDVDYFHEFIIVNKLFYRNVF